MRQLSLVEVEQRDLSAVERSSDSFLDTPAQRDKYVDVKKQTEVPEGRAACVCSLRGMNIPWNMRRPIDCVTWQLPNVPTTEVNQCILGEELEDFEKIKI